MLPFLTQAARGFNDNASADPLTFTLFHQAPMQGFGRLSIERSQLQLRTPFMDNDLVQSLYQAPPALLQKNVLTDAIIARYNPHLLNIPTDRGLRGSGPQVARHLRAAYREFLFKAEYYSSHGMPGWLSPISRGRMGRLLEKTFIGRHKFQHFRLWTQRQLAPYVTDIVSDGAKDLSEYFNTKQVEIMLREHMRGVNNYTNELDTLMTLSLARKCLFHTIAGKCAGAKNEPVMAVAHDNRVRESAAAPCEFN
jgi:asparagine synthase (glutamine-hydrolysing)